MKFSATAEFAASDVKPPCASVKSSAAMAIALGESRPGSGVPFTKYSKVIRTLYGSTAAGFLMGLTYAIGHVSNEEGSLPMIAYRIFVVLAAVAALYLGQRLVVRDRTTLNWFQCVIAFALVGAGIFILVVSAIRLLR